MTKKIGEKTGFKFFSTILYIVLFIVPIRAQEGAPEEKANYDINSRWRMELSLLLGLGLQNHEVGRTTENDKITLSGGGGYGGAFMIGYGINTEFDLSLGFGMQNSPLQPTVENAKGNFLRTNISGTIKYRIPITAKGLLKFGLGGGYYIPGDLDADFSKVPEGAHNIYGYKAATGFHLTAEYEGFFNEKLSWVLGLKYYNVSYQMESAQSNGVIIPIDMLPVEIKDDIGELNGSGVDLILTINLYL